MAGKRKSTPKGRAPKKKSASGANGQRVWLRRTLKWGSVTALVMALVVAGFGAWVYQTTDIPDPNEEFLTEATQVYYAGGKQRLGNFAIQQRDSIPLEEMPDVMKDAVVAAENRSFWTDKGIDPKGILRAAFSNAQGNATQGASTITQQYVKILYLTQERTLERKLKEAVLSLKVQNQLSKSEVLEGYLNTIYFGRGAYGIQAAAQAYFRKDAADLNLRQAAVLASVLNNPSRFDPSQGDAAEANLKVRYDYVLDSMADTGSITEKKAEKAMRKLPKFPKIASDNRYGGQRGHVLQMVRKELLRLGFSEQEIDGGGLQVTTTFTRKHMAAAEQGALEARPDGFSDKELHVGVAAVEPGTGAIRGIFGGQDYLDSQLNWAVEGAQAGSIFKPIELAAGMEQGFDLKDQFHGDSPITTPDGTEIENQRDRDYGRVNMVEGIQNSINTAFIDMAMGMNNGPAAIVRMANRMGVPSHDADEKAPYGFPTSSPGLRPFLSVGLGPQTVSPINMANAYATIANDGERADAYIIEKVVDDDGRTRYKHKVTTGRAVQEDIARDVSYTLQNNAKVGTGAGSNIGRPSAGKTGTATNDKGWVTSAWYVGYTPQLSVAVSYARGTGVGQLDGWLPSFFGSGYPLDTWNAVMRRAMEGEEIEPFPPRGNYEGEAPSEGYEPPPPPKPKKTKKPKQAEETSEEPTEETSEPEPEPTKETESPGVIDCLLPKNKNHPDCESEEPSPDEPTTSDTSDPPPPGNGGGGAGGGGGDPSPSESA